MRIAVIGAGAFGTALGGILTKNGHEVRYYDPKLGNDINEALDGVEMTLLAVPSTAVTMVLPDLPKEIPLIVATKGILKAEEFGEFRDVMVLSGPGFASDIEAEKNTKLTITDGRLRNLFNTGHIDFDETNDIRGVLMCGALKNVYAIYAGYLNLVPDTEETANFVGASISEIKAILDANGANPDTAELSCGRDDLVLTCAPESRNYTFGFNISKDTWYRPDYTVEGLSTIAKLRQHEINLPENLPILTKILEETWN